MCVGVHNRKKQSSVVSSRGGRERGKRKRQKVMERIRKRQHKRKCIAPIYKPETGALDWVVENKTEREKKKRTKGGVTEIKTGEWVKKDEKMDRYKEEMETGGEKGEGKEGGGIHLP